MGWFARGLYSTALRLATPLYLLRLLWRSRREPAYGHRLAERLGFYPGRQPLAERPPLLWLHAVSLGETRAAEPLVLALRRRLPGWRLLLTSGTATGAEAAARLLAPGDLQTWLPFDTPGAVRRFLRRHRPTLGVLMETEVWPNLLHGARAAGVPMALANARLSVRSARRGERMAALMRPAAAAFAKVLAQTVDDAQRLRAAGAHHVQVCGNLKFDMTPAPKLLARGLEWRQALNGSGVRAVVLAASLREGEEALLLEAWRQLILPRPLLLLVPRHPQRFDAVAQLVEQAGYTLARRSAWDEQPPAGASHAEVWLGDSLGEMPLYYAAADVALLGGSFLPLGGQNLIEAAACGCPVVMGPHTFNFAEASEMAIEAEAAVRVADFDEGVRRASALANDPLRNDWVRNAFDFAARHRGATERMADELAELARAGDTTDR